MGREFSNNEETLYIPKNANLRDKILLSLLSFGALVETELAKAATPRTISFTLSSIETQNFILRKRSSIHSTTSYLLTKKLIKAIGKRRKREYLVTEEGLEYVFNRFPKIKFKDQTWDGYWRIVIYDIKETEKQLRNRLRLELRSLGYMYIQKSVWITPYPVEAELEQYLRKEKLWGKILVLKSTMPSTDSKKLMPEFYV